MKRASTESVLGTVSVRKFTTLLTSNSSLLSTSPLCLFSFPLHSDLRIRSSIRCCILFWAFIPSMFLTHTAEMLMANPQRISSPISATAQ